MSHASLSSRICGLVALRHYQRRWLRPDVIAGLTVAAYLIPQVMAYAGVAGLPPVAGLWATLPAMSAYVVFGSSRQLSVGPESTTALLAATAIAPRAGGDPVRYAQLCALLAMLVGATCVLAHVFRLGFLADLLSKPVLTGYMAGVAVIMMIGQLHRTTGVPVTGETLLGELRTFSQNLDKTHWTTVLVAALTLAFLVALAVWLPRWPGALLAVVCAAVAVSVLDLRGHGVAVVGPVPSGLPSVHLPGVSSGDIRSLLLPAFGVAVVGFTDNVLTARAFADRGKYSIDGNQELLAIGFANLGSGLMSGFPVSSSGSRTALGDTAGSRSQLHSIVVLVVVAAVLMFGGGALAAFPQAALGAIIVFAAARLVDVAEIRRIAQFRRSELVLGVVTFFGVLTLDILYGVLLAVGLSVAELLSRVARPHDAILGEVPGLAGMHDVDDFPAARTIPGLVVYRYDSPLFFANAEDFKRRALEAVRAADPPARWLLVNTEAIVEVDITGLDALEWLRAELAAAGIVLALARVKQDLLDDLQAHGLATAIGTSLLFPTLPTAVAAYRAATGDQSSETSK